MTPPPPPLLPLLLLWRLLLQCHCRRHCCCHHRSSNCRGKLSFLRWPNNSSTAHMHCHKLASSTLVLQPPLPPL